MNRRKFLIRAGAVAGAAAVSTPAFSQATKRIYIVQSYEKGHVCGEPQAEGILTARRGRRLDGRS